MPYEIVFPAKSAYELRPYDDNPLAQDEIRGQSLATLVSPGTEIGWSDGDDFPVRPGYAAVFRVDAVGNAVVGVAPGDLRFCMGLHRQTQQCSVRHSLPLPDGLSVERALLARLMGVSMSTMMSTRARAGDKVAVLGAGPVGMLAAHNFICGGYRVVLIEPDMLRRKQAQLSGVSEVLAEIAEEDSKWRGECSLVVDCSGHESAVMAACDLVRPRGEVVLVGVPWRRQSELYAHDLLRSVFFNFVHLRSGWEWDLPMHARDFVWEELLDGYNNAAHSIFGGFTRALDWLAEGAVKTEGLFESVSPSEPAAFYASLRDRAIDAPFIVFDWQALPDSN